MKPVSVKMLFPAYVLLFTAMLSCSFYSGGSVPSSSSASSVSSSSSSFSGDVYYISPGGSDATGNGTTIQPWASLNKAFAVMKGGDMLVVKDGTYTGISNQITSTLYPPVGSSGAWTIIKAENDGAAVFDGEYARSMFLHNGGTQSDAYWQFEGLVWCRSSSSVMQILNRNRVKYLRCGAYDAGAGNVAMFGIGRNTSYVLLEGCYAYGQCRSMIAAYQSDHIIFRNCVARMDGVNVPTEPMYAIAMYSVDYGEIQNCIVVDSDRTSNYSASEVSGCFCVPSTDRDANHIRFVNCIGLNSKIGGLTTTGNEYYRANDVTFIDCVLWDCSKWNGAVNNIFRGLNSVITNCTFGIENGQWAGIWSYDSYGDNNTVFKNNIVYQYHESGEQVIFDVETCDYNCLYDLLTGVYKMTTPGAHDKTSINPRYHASTNPTGALKYLTRIENGSNLDGQGENGVDIGANVATLIGKSGTLWGEPGYNTDTGISMWPFPNEDLIRSKMKAYNAGGVSGNRGFCADGQTLTRYIWEYLGNPIPAGIY